MRHTNLKHLSWLGALVLALATFPQAGYAAGGKNETVSKDCVKETEQWEVADKKSDQEFEQAKAACSSFEHEKATDKKAKLAETCEKQMQELATASDKKLDEFDDIPKKCAAK